MISGDIILVICSILDITHVFLVIRLLVHPFTHHVIPNLYELGKWTLTKLSLLENPCHLTSFTVHCHGVCMRILRQGCLTPKKIRLIWRFTDSLSISMNQLKIINLCRHNVHKFLYKTYIFKCFKKNYMQVNIAFNNIYILIIIIIIIY